MDGGLCGGSTDASKSGVAQETVQNMAHKVSKTMSEHEARQILGVTEKSSWEEIMKVWSLTYLLCKLGS